MGEISVIDFSKLIGNNASKKDWLEVADQVNSACQGLGFMYIVNHGIPKEMVDSVLESGAKFFKLPQSRKDDFKIEYIKYRGHTKIGQETLDPSSPTELRENFSVVGYDSPQPFPEEIPELRKSIYAFWSVCAVLLKKVLKLFALALDLPDENFFITADMGVMNSSISNRITVRIQWYPPVTDFEQLPEKAIRCGEHTDYGVCTFLFQDMIGGLEVKNAQGHWVPATPLPDAVLVNLGDIMEIWTGGRFKATPHRVLIPADEQFLRRSRMSLAFFSVADDDYMITPLKASPYYDFGKDFEAMKYVDFLDKRLGATYH